MCRKPVLKYRAMGQTIKPLVRVGKRGVTPELIRELKRMLKDHGLVKVLILKSGEKALKLGRVERRELALGLAAKTDSEVVDVRGKTIVLVDRKLVEKSGC